MTSSKPLSLSHILSHYLENNGKKIIFFVAIFLVSCDLDSGEDLIIPQSNEWVFVACEGNFGASNGSITMINNLGEVKSVVNKRS